MLPSDGTLPGEDDLASAKIPQRLDELTPDWLTQVLGPDWLRGARVATVRCEPLGEGEGFVGQLVRLHLGLDGDAPGAPRSVIAKLPTTVAANRATGELMGAYEREILFYRHLASRVPYRTARLYHADMDENPGAQYGPAIVRFMDRLPAWLMRLLMLFFLFVARQSSRRYVLLLEDLAPARLGDQVAGLAAADCLPVVRAMARAQAALWRSPLLDDRYWVARVGDGVRVGQAMYQGSRPGFETRFAALLGPEDRAALEWLDRNGVALVRALVERAPVTLVHGDFRLDNLFFDGGEDPLLVDWQGVAGGPGVIDLAYFVSGSLPPDTAPEEELRLVRAYHAALVAAGVSDYDFDDCLRDYRRCVLLMLQRIVTIDWVDLGEERGAELIERWVARILARIRCVERAALLPSPDGRPQLR